MRRSRWTTTLGVGGACLLVLGSCGDSGVPAKLPPNLDVFSDVTSCMGAGNPEELCRSSLREAATDHYAKAPHFADRTSCEVEYGASGCDVIHPGGGMASYFAPALAGFVLGRALGISNAVPVHYDRQGFARVAGGDTRLGRRCDGKGDGGCASGGGTGSSTVGNWKSRSRVDTASANVASAGPVSRGGFGQSVGRFLRVAG